MGADQKVYFRNGKIMNDARKCLTPHNFKNQEKQTLTFWHCRKIKLQQWRKEYSGVAAGNKTKKNDDLKELLSKKINDFFKK